jgi:hypothetical protein
MLLCRFNAVKGNAGTTNGSLDSDLNNLLPGESTDTFSVITQKKAGKTVDFRPVGECDKTALVATARATAATR